MIETLKYLYELDIDTDQVNGSIVDAKSDEGDHSKQSFFAENPMVRPRLPHEILFVCGGWSGGSPTAVVELYDVRFIGSTDDVIPLE